MRGLLAIIAATSAATSPADSSFDPRRVLDVELTAFASTPERFALCVGAHPGRPVELDVCVGGDQGLLTLTSHGFYRFRWSFPHGGADRGLVLAAGAGAGVRVKRLCPYGTCAVAAGPELLGSLEAVEWLSARVGLTLQVDGGLALLWTAAAPRRLELMIDFPVHLLAGVAF